MKKLTLLLLLTLSVLGVQAQTYQLNYDSIRVGKTAGTGGTSLYGKVYLKNVGLGLVSDSILTVLNGRIRKIPTISQFWQRSGTTLSPTTSGDNVAITVSNANGLIVTNNSATEAAISSRNNGSGNIHQFLNTTGAISAINNNGLLQTASGLSTEFLKANGTVDGSTYLTPTGSGSGLSGVVLTSGNQTIAGDKTLTGSLTAPVIINSTIASTATNAITGNFINNSTGFVTIKATNSGSGNLAEFANSGGVVASIGNTGIITLADEAYTSSWNGKLEAPTKNAIWDAFGASGGIWQVAAGVITPITANNQLSVTSNTGASITAFNSGSGGLGFYGFSSAGNGGQFESSSAGSVGIIARNSGGGNIQNWLNTSSQVATISNSGSISSTPQGTLYGTASGSITSTQLATSLTDETGTGSAVFNSSPSITTPTFATSATINAGTSNINFGATSNYGYASFNGSTSLSGMLGMFGGGSGDLTSLYLQAPTGGSLDFRVDVLDAFQVNASGDIIIAGNNATKASGTAWINPSDLRLKMNVGDYSKGLAEVLKIKPKTWYFNKASGFDQTKKHLSPIAQELKLIMPEMVSTYKGKLNGKEQELLQVDASDMTWLLVKAIQEQQAIIEKLNQRITLLEQK